MLDKQAAQFSATTSGGGRPVWMDQVDVLIKSLDRLSVAMEKSQREFSHKEKPTILTFQDGWEGNGSTVTVEKRGNKFYYPGTDKEYPGENHGL